MHTNFEKRKVQQAASGNFVQKWLFCKTYVLYNMTVSLSVAKILDKHFRSSSYLLQAIFKEKIHSHGKFTERLFLLPFRYIKFFEQIFLRIHTCGWWKKKQTNYQRKLKLGDKLWALEIAYWKCLYGQLFCIRQISQFLQFYRVSLAQVCAVLINIFEKFHLINSVRNLRPPKHLNRSFLWQ